MSRGVDFTEFKQYVNKFKKAHNDSNRFIEEFLLEMAERLITIIRPRHTKGHGLDTGAMKNAWDIGKIIVQSGTSLDNMPSYAYEGITRDGDTIRISIVNGMKYASFVEYGHATRSSGWVGGLYILTISKEQIMEEMNPRFQVAFKNWIDEMGLGD